MATKMAMNAKSSVRLPFFAPTNIVAANSATTTAQRAHGSIRTNRPALMTPPQPRRNSPVPITFDIRSTHGDNTTTSQWSTDRRVRERGGPIHSDMVAGTPSRDEGRSPNELRAGFPTRQVMVAPGKVYDLVVRWA